MRKDFGESVKDYKSYYENKKMSDIEFWLRSKTIKGEGTVDEEDY